jgi:transcriptional regulator with PAS, ATPase and Fis domain
MLLTDEITAIFHALREGILLIDTQEKIVFANQRYLDFLHRSKEEILGRPLREIRPGARLPTVLRTGQPIFHAPRQENVDEEIYFVNMYPVRRDNEVVGGLSVITFLEDACSFQEQLESYEKRSKKLLHRVNRANSARYTFDSITAVGETMQAAKALARRAAATDVPVLLASESGTGKELFAQAIHNASPRGGGVFVAINCANFNANTLESELFGYVEGAFTGAKKGGKMGLFEAASGGTLFLDEVSEMDIGLQAKLLRALQEGRVRPVGAVEEIEVDVRLICASNADLSAYIQAGKFRQDLFYRLSTFQIRIPPLRERREDIPALAETILADLAKKLKRSVEITPEALACLMEHDWPGNVRELRNALEASVYLSDNGCITPDTLPAHLLHRTEEKEELPLAQRVRAFEREEIRKLLQRYGSTLEGKKRAAAELGISLATLYNKLGTA